MKQITWLKLCAMSSCQSRSEMDASSTKTTTEPPTWPVLYRNTAPNNQANDKYHPSDTSGKVHEKDWDSENFQSPLRKLIQGYFGLSVFFLLMFTN